MPHPCLTCGACCAHFRVAFHWSETDAAPGGLTPGSLTEPLDPHRVALRGTWGDTAIRCVALRGEVGVGTSCEIYAKRPSPCRDVNASWEQGKADAHCDRARAAHGLAPLQPSDWGAAIA
ncbi:YkgJ family cysteine cluster protein [Cognatilysobacter terrigena]|uniref:YkgJ family cysteine cluster protein n=1 Tax=Cognatilysobacter terrigena TaxID=2488749 RepID=UPI00105E3CBD|nr:YkgJ family cysteine cluster protein [Lysobacter terrigena]